MSAIEESKSEAALRQPVAAQAVRPASPSFVTRVLNLLSSVRFGVVLLVLLAAACMLGMLIVQQNVQPDFERYYADLTPAQKLIYGKLGFFDIYHVWYFNALLLLLSLNIVLASIDRFPAAWTYISRKKLDASAHWLRGQQPSTSFMADGASREEVAGKISAAFRAEKLKPTVTEKNGKTFVFGERGAWNRLGAYAVHVALLTIFFGGFMTSQFGRNGNMPLEPGTTSKEIQEQVIDVDQFSVRTHQLPFQVECTDIQQELMRKDGAITSDNTLNWLTRIKIKDPAYGEREGLVSLNNPYDYRGYRFFQASFIADGKARRISLQVTPAAGGPPQEVGIPRDGSAQLADGTRIDFKDFQSNFSLGRNRPQSDEEGSVYNNPAAVLAVTPPGGQAAKAFAFTPEMAERAPFAKQPVAGYTFRLVDFEKAPKAHILAVQRDPGATVVYVGFTLLALTLCAVFFFSHERVWALVEERGAGKYEVVVGGNTNRNQLAFGDRFRRVVAQASGQPLEVKES
ncbi:MAG TPA: cytochrome c biogenesis protein ResB [Pyrinomonadaceae bacterium]|jgi:cytochrome c biogenesis protein|nr:cytochrome c biogenesis protein ResB [Pyrinomonadaceae bacterium]